MSSSACRYAARLRLNGKYLAAHRTGRLSMRLATPSHIYGMADAIKTDILSCSIPCLSKPNLQWPDLQCILIPLFASQAEKGHNSGSLFIQPPGCSLTGLRDSSIFPLSPMGDN